MPLGGEYLGEVPLPGEGEPVGLLAVTSAGSGSGFTILDHAATAVDTIRPLDPYAEILLDMLPRYYRGDLYAVAALNSLGRELGRIAVFLDTLRQQFFPQNADDTYGLLGIWEHQLDLPVRPPLLTIAQRQQRALGVIRGRRVGRGSDWVSAVTSFLGTSQWDHAENEPGPYSVQVLIPYDPTGGFTTGEVQAFLRRITPAHLDIQVGYLGGFVVDVSLVDEAALED